MSDNPIESEEEEITEGKKSSRWRFSFSSLLVRILVYIAVGIVFIILMGVVSTITYRLLSGGNRDVELYQISNDFVINNPIYKYYDQIEVIRTRSADLTPRSISVKVEMGYDQERYPNLSEELTRRRPQLTDLFRKYFARRTAKEISSANEDFLKEELRAMVNELLQNGRIEEVVFTDFQVLDF